MSVHPPLNRMISIHQLLRIQDVISMHVQNRIGHSNSQTVRFSDFQSLRLSDYQTLRPSDSQTLRLSGSQALWFSDFQTLRPQTPCFSGSRILRLSDSFSFSVSPRFSHNRQDSRNLRLLASQNRKFPDSQTPTLYNHACVHNRIGLSDSLALRLSVSQILKVSGCQILPRLSDSQNPRFC